MSTTAVMEPITSRIKSEDKREFTDTCERIGTSPSNAIRMFITAFNNKGGFPFDPTTSPKFNEETIRAIEDVKNNRNLIGPFDSVDEAFTSLLGDE